ncbi:hypothetical protein, partial [Staphylococcus felis]|uniref:hypothetical protein n=1 Tax=Staphylococcus felis TaxID=46127 RepID=UPI001EE7E5E5
VFASDFLQIPLRNGHPCLSLTVPSTKPVTDFHRQVITHAGRTIKNPLTITVKGFFLFTVLFPLDELDVFH